VQYGVQRQVLVEPVMVTQVGYSMARAIKRLGGGVCGLHRARGDEEREFLG
jgi:hypothetical protein